MASSSRDLAAKVVLLGEGRVGKTSLLLRYTRDAFDPNSQPTIQAAYLAKRVPRAAGAVAVQLALWDTAGQERFHALGPIYYRDADSALLVFDVTDLESFDKVKSWVRELRKMVRTPILLVIAGNKVDLEKDRVVSRQVAVEYAESVGAHYGETSAKTGRGVSELFGTLASRLATGGTLRPGYGPTGGSSSLSVSTTQVDEGDSRGRGCC